MPQMSWRPRGKQPSQKPSPVHGTFGAIPPEVSFNLHADIFRSLFPISLVRFDIFRLPHSCVVPWLSDDDEELGQGATRTAEQAAALALALSVAAAVRRTSHLVCGWREISCYRSRIFTRLLLSLFSDELQRGRCEALCKSTFSVAYSLSFFKYHFLRRTSLDVCAVSKPLCSPFLSASAAINYADRGPIDASRHL
jgi:hypothetical protein